MKENKQLVNGEWKDKEELYGMRKEQFYSMYTQYCLRKIIRDYTHRRVYKHWNNWCFKGANGIYGFEKGYDEDYAKGVI